MAIISAVDGDDLRRQYRGSVPVTATKPVIRAAFQAVEDWAVANSSALSTAINAATVPLGVTLTAAEKKALFAAWCDYKFRKDR